MLKARRKLRKIRIRSRLSGTKDRPRFSVYKSNKFIYTQLIDDEKGITLASAKGTKAGEVGEEIASQAMKINIKSIVFDRSGYKYHGQVKEIGEALRSKKLLK